MKSTYYSLNSLIVSTFFAFPLAGCGKQFKGNENVILRNSVETAKIEDKSKVSITQLKGSKPDAYICVLEPYREKIASGQKYYEEINSLLARANYKADEGHWAILQYVEKEVDVAIFQQAKLRLAEGSIEKSVGGRCSPAHDVFLTGNSSAIQIIFDGDKK